MPGITLTYHKRNLDLLKSVPFNSLTDDMDNYVIKKLNADEKHLILFTCYDSYPCIEFETDKYKFFIEGRIYNENEAAINIQLKNISEDIFVHKNYHLLFDWIKGKDGDFLGYIFRKESGEIILFNDFLGRLPTYYITDNEERIILSRSINFLVKSLGEPVFNKLSLAHFLLLGYNLGNSTFFPQIQHLQPFTIIHIKPHKNIEFIEGDSQLNYEEKCLFNGKRKAHLDKLTNLFIESCKNRAEKDKINVLSLSGGLDSRIVASGLFKAGTIFETTTLQDPWKVNTTEGDLEVRLAKEVAKQINVSSKLFMGKPGRGRDFYSLLNLKGGTNHLGFSYLLRYLDDIYNEYTSKIVFFTGDGGDKVIKYQLPSVNLKNFNSLVNYILKVHKRFNIQSVAKLTKIKEPEIIESIVAHLKAYPEKNFNYKYVHFIFHERVNNWLFEGEDRNRSFFWSVTPFYSTEFFLTSMQLPDKYKKWNCLYIDMLEKLKPELNNIIYANLKWPVNSLKSKTYLISKSLYNKLPENYRSTLRNTLKKNTIVNYTESNTFNVLKKQIKNSKLFFEKYFDTDEILGYSKLNSEELKMLFNLITTMEYHSKSNRVLDEYLDTEFYFK